MRERNVWTVSLKGEAVPYTIHTVRDEKQSADPTFHLLRVSSPYEWSAATNQPGSPLGYGPTEEKAIKDLIRQLKRAY